MNTQNFKPFEPSWEEIFKLQKELKFLYEPEAKQLFENFDIDCFEDQELFKKYCWRITEELTEAEQAYIEEENKKEHIKEELIDALNFSIELMLLYGWGREHFPIQNDFSAEFFLLPRVGSIIYSLGITANCLKNRQWRRSQYLVDLYVFESNFIKFITKMSNLLMNIFDYDVEIRKAWSLKYQVNLFRIQTNY